MRSTAPPYRTSEPEFYRCAVCGTVNVRYRPLNDQMLVPAEVGNCCGQPLTELSACMDVRSCSGEHEMKYCVFGGFAHNTVRVEVAEGLHPMNEEHYIEWIFLRTFQGGQMKYLPFKGESATLFSMANEDAYVFCDREVCRMGWEHCLFQCKRGYVAFAYCNQHGLLRLPF